MSSPATIAGKVAIRSPLDRFGRWPVALVDGFVRGELVRKAACCTDTLDRARALLLAGRAGRDLDRLIATAREQLDDLRTRLLAIDPAGKTRHTAAAARRHREMERSLAAIASARRVRTARGMQRAPGAR